MFAFFFGAFSCFALHTLLQVPVVLAAAIVGLAGSFWNFPASYEHHPQAAIYAGAFAGMCSGNFIESWWLLALICVLGASFYTVSRGLFTGFGGRLGAIAFVAVAGGLVVRDFL